jgi:hypothetical protein
MNERDHFGDVRVDETAFDLTTLSVDKIIQRLIIGCLTNIELEMSLK